jgi:hypothetical protein
MFEAGHGERKNIPSGMCECQKSMDSPKARISSPFIWRKWAPAANP